MFDELARLRFFIPKPFKKARYPDKYPFVVMENISEGQNAIRGKFPDENNARIFLDSLKSIYIAKMKQEMEKAIEAEIAVR